MPEPSRSLVMTGDLATVEAASVAWVDRTSPEERAAIATALRKHDTSTIPGVLSFANDVTVMLLVGELSPSAAAAARPWIELIVANVWQMNASAGHPQGTGSAVAQALSELRERVRAKTTYQVTQSFDVEEESAPARERIVLKGG